MRMERMRMQGMRMQGMRAIVSAASRETVTIVNCESGNHHYHALHMMTMMMAMTTVT